jgi:hypothetical protein
VSRQRWAEVHAWTRRALLAGDALGARGGHKGGAGDGKQPWRALQTQEVVKVVPWSTAGACFKRESGSPLERVAVRGRRLRRRGRGGTAALRTAHATSGAGRGCTTGQDGVKHVDVVQGIARV